jgi:hypothetical protein
MNFIGVKQFVAIIFILKIYSQFNFSDLQTLWTVPQLPKKAGSTALKIPRHRTLGYGPRFIF